MSRQERREAARQLAKKVSTVPDATPVPVAGQVPLLPTACQLLLSQTPNGPMFGLKLSTVLAEGNIYFFDVPQIKDLVAKMTEFLASAAPLSVVENKLIVPPHT